MQKNELVESMSELLQPLLGEEKSHGTLKAPASLPLVGQNAVISSMQLVSFIIDVEVMVAERYGTNLTLVSEKALARETSPFRSIDTLADYILELTGMPVKG